MMMDLDIETEHVVLSPEWQGTIDAWIAHCRREHPAVRAVDLMLRRRERDREMEVDAVATAGSRNLRASRHSAGMAAALHDALDALEHEILVHEAVTRPVRAAA
jgi:ribosome-associated translation inhibitor RaiA